MWRWLAWAKAPQRVFQSGLAPASRERRAQPEERVCCGGGGSPGGRAGSQQRRTPCGPSRPPALSSDDFVRTSADPRHAPAVQRLWRSSAAGDLYRAPDSGAYCVGGEYPEHRLRPEPVREDNCYFRLSRYQQRLVELLESGALRVEPPSHRRAGSNSRGVACWISASRARPRALAVGALVGPMIPSR